MPRHSSISSSVHAQQTPPFAWYHYVVGGIGNGRNGGEAIEKDAGNDCDCWAWGRFLSVDPLQRKYPDLSPYHFSGNSPVATVERGGRDYILVVWSTQEDNQGHAAIAIENVESFIDENGVEQLRPTGTYNLYEVYPAGQSISPATILMDPNYITEGYVSVRTNLTLENVLGARIGQDRKPTGAVRFQSDPTSDMQAISRLDKLVSKPTTTPDRRHPDNPFLIIEGETTYDPPVSYKLTTDPTDSDCTYSCSSFVADMVKRMYQQEIGPPESIDLTGGTFIPPFMRVALGLPDSFSETPSIHVKGWTPGQLFRNAIDAGGESIIPERSGANREPFIDQYSGGNVKDETPNN